MFTMYVLLLARAGAWKPAIIITDYIIGTVWGHALLLLLPLQVQQSSAFFQLRMFVERYCSSAGDPLTIPYMYPQ